jgi:hypothetical protein
MGVNSLERDTHPGPARERSRVIVHRVVALNVANSKHARSHVGRESPISNGSTAVAAVYMLAHPGDEREKKRTTNAGQILDVVVD